VGVGEREILSSPKENPPHFNKKIEE